MKERRPNLDLLLPVEKQYLRGEYGEFFKTKRNNFLATVQAFSGLWNAYQLLDDIWVEEIRDLQRLRERRQIFPALFFIHAHIKYCIARELAFSCCLVEAWGTLRVGIESVAQGYKIYREPHLSSVWLSKDDGKRQYRAYRNAFEKDKRKSLFPKEHGLSELYDYWQFYSDLGSHTTLASMATRFRQIEKPADINWKLEYFETGELRLVTSLYSLLTASQLLERVFFNVYETRFTLDYELTQKRAQFEKQHKRFARSILRKYGVKNLFSFAPDET